MINLGSVSAGDAVSALNSLLQVYALSSGKTPMRSDKNIAEWKKYSKDVMGDLGEAQNLYKNYKEKVKKFEFNKHDLSSSGPWVAMMGILDEAHEKSEAEKNAQSYQITQLLKKIGSVAGIRGSSKYVPLIDVLAKFPSAIMALCAKFEKQLEDEKAKILETRGQDLTRTYTGNVVTVGKSLGTVSEKLGDLCKKTQAAVKVYTSAEIDKIEYYFSNILDEVKSSTAETKKIPGKKEDMIKTMPFTLVFLKILCSLAGIRSAGTDDSEAKSKYGEYGNGFIAKVCYMAEQELEQKVGEFQRDSGITTTRGI